MGLDHVRRYTHSHSSSSKKSLTELLSKQLPVSCGFLYIGNIIRIYFYLLIALLGFGVKICKDFSLPPLCLTRSSCGFLLLNVFTLSISMMGKKMPIMHFLQLIYVRLQHKVCFFISSIEKGALSLFHLCVFFMSFGLLFFCSQVWREINLTIRQLPLRNTSKLSTTCGTTCSSSSW